MIYMYYNNILGRSFTREHRIDLGSLGIPRLDLEALDVCFSTEEIWNMVRGDLGSDHGGRG